MNTYITTAGLLAALTTLGHFGVGRRAFLGPMLAAEFEPVPKRVMLCVFHYVSTFLILSTLTLLAAGLKGLPTPGATALVVFIAANYAGFAVWQLALALTSGLPHGPLKLFQWLFFVLIAGFAALGLYV